MNKVVLLSNHHAYTYNFRKEIIQKLINENYKVYIVLPRGEKVELLEKMGCEFIEISLDRRGMNPLADFKLLFSYYKIIKTIEPNVVLSYTIKPNIYGGLVCRIANVPFFPNITGLGSAVENKGFIQQMLILMFRLAYRKAKCIFFQNEENLRFFQDKNILINKYRVIPGSGVNIQYFNLLPYPSGEIIEFAFISRIMKEKGIDQYLEAALYIRDKYPNTRFHVCGFCEEEYEENLKILHSKGIIQYHGLQKDIREILKKTHCTIHPTYYPEGMSNVLLESAACGRPVITTNRSGCREIVDDGISGYLVNVKNG
ncbi:MAG TPA: glycosyltransferase family 1 protein, partial [Sporomusaceae bacterium]|nr:glycosyltransferase family 1 protein [Sporomusaceae bacterium]